MPGASRPPSSGISSRASLCVSFPMAVRSGFLFSTGLLFGDTFSKEDEISEGIAQENLSSLTIPEKEEECKFLPLAGRAKLRKHELLCKSNELASFLPHACLWTTQSKQPFRVRDLPQVQLRTAKMCLQAARILHS